MGFDDCLSLLMHSKGKKTALVIGHPGHELRIYGIVELYKPRVYIITDGSGNSGHSRVYNSVKILEQSGATMSPIAGYFTDKEIYRVILENDFAALDTFIKTLWNDLQSHPIDTIIGDAIEGFNPTHDLCRYIINTLVRLLNKNRSTQLNNYDFLLDRMITPDEETEAISLRLTNENFETKYTAAANYEELAAELKMAIEKYGKEPFKTEYIRPVFPIDESKNWKDGIPYYEKYGLEKIKAGTYKQAITYTSHMKPIIEWLNQYSFD